MDEPIDLIPPPAVVRLHLARGVRRVRLLKGLLKLSIQAAEPMVPPPAPPTERRTTEHG